MSSLRINKHAKNAINPPPIRLKQGDTKAYFFFKTKDIFISY